MKIGPRLRRFRILAGLTQQELADKLGVSRASVSLYESGDREPDIAQQKRLAAALGITLPDLLGEGQLQDLPAETIAFARQLESLDDEQRAALMEFVRKTFLGR